MCVFPCLHICSCLRPSVYLPTLPTTRKEMKTEHLISKSRRQNRVKNAMIIILTARNYFQGLHSSRTSVHRELLIMTLLHKTSWVYNHRSSMHLSKSFRYFAGHLKSMMKHARAAPQNSPFITQSMSSHIQTINVFACATLLNIYLCEKFAIG